MKTIIKGRLYDTDTAKRLTDEIWNEKTGFARVDEALYRKKTGEYFLYGEGGPASKYRVSSGPREWSGSRRIIPLTYEEAREWAEDNMDADQYLQHFGVEELDDESSHMTMISISIPAVIAERIRREAEQSGRTIGETIASKFRTEK